MAENDEANNTDSTPFEPRLRIEDGQRRGHKSIDERGQPQDSTPYMMWTVPQAPSHSNTQQSLLRYGAYSSMGIDNSGISGRRPPCRTLSLAFGSVSLPAATAALHHPARGRFRRPRTPSPRAAAPHHARTFTRAAATARRCPLPPLPPGDALPRHPAPPLAPDDAPRRCRRCQSRAHAHSCRRYPVTAWRHPAPPPPPCTTPHGVGFDAQRRCRPMPPPPSRARSPVPPLPPGDAPCRHDCLATPHDAAPHRRFRLATPRTAAAALHRTRTFTHAAATAWRCPVLPRPPGNAPHRHDHLATPRATPRHCRPLNAPAPPPSITLQRAAPRRCADARARSNERACAARFQRHTPPLPGTASRTLLGVCASSFLTPCHRRAAALAQDSSVA
ncbi:hypothetical protein GGX14DRAFT_643131 [Mycena pura]|uniref:Uncharacterized protein n=1 Tax=Mycena pura TaxID=153505 RepID=A0AAD7E3G0_9AGAR|nr:hypothetical protein GGX14DRAFT_643131 [Mycena pura]